MPVSSIVSHDWVKVESSTRTRTADSSSSPLGRHAATAIAAQTAIARNARRICGPLMFDLFVVISGHGHRRGYSYLLGARHNCRKPGRFERRVDRGQNDESPSHCLQ